MKKLMIMLSLVAVGFGCAKKDNNNTATTTTAYMCIVASTGAQVATQLCTSSVNANYICVLNGTQVPNTSCANGGYICSIRSSGQQVTSTICNASNVGIYRCSDAAGTEVDPTLCQQNVSGTGTGMYQNIGGVCYQNINGVQQPLPSNLQYLCQQNGTGIGGVGGVIQQQCYGWYIYSGDGRLYNCGVATNCSNALMTSQATGQQVQCL
jgi:hypothetical protein